MKLHSSQHQTGWILSVAIHMWIFISPVMTVQKYKNNLLILLHSSQMMTNLRNLCISLMKLSNPFSDDCCLKSSRKSKLVPKYWCHEIGRMWNVSYVITIVFFFLFSRYTRRRRPGLSLRMRRNSKHSPACVWPAPMLVFSASVPREPRRLPSRTWKRRSENSHDGTLQNKVFKKINVRMSWLRSC